LQVNLSSGSINTRSGNIIKHTFCKAEKLCSVKIISNLFESGNIFHNKLFKVVWMDSPVQLSFPAQVAFSVTKRSFKHAVKRNLIRRRMREAYRKNKQHLYRELEEVNRQLVFTIIFKGYSIPTYELVEKNMKEVVTTLTELSAGDKC
jgi:ribonuclease P protein component